MKPAPTSTGSPFAARCPLPRPSVWTVLVLASALGAVALPAQEPPTGPDDPYPVAVLERVVADRRDGPPGALGLALQDLTNAYVYHGRHEEAVHAGREALALLEVTADTTGLALTHNQLGLAHWNLAQYDSAVIRFSLARDLWTAIDDRESLGRVHNNLGATHYQWGNYELALSSFLRALDFRRETGQEAGQALALTNVGRTYHDWSQFDRARDAYEEAIGIADRIEYAFGQAYARLNLAELLADEEDGERAEQLFLESLALYDSEESGIPPTDALGGRILNALGLGMVRIRRGDTGPGLTLLMETLETARSAENPRYEARARLELGRALLLAGRPEEAFEHLTAGLEAARSRDQRPIALDLLAALAEVEELRGVPDRALSHLRSHTALRDSIFDQGAVQRLAAMEAEAEVERRERENALLREEQLVREATIGRQRVITFLTGGLLLSAVLLLGVLVHFNRRGRERERALSDTNRSLEETNRALREARSEVQTLKGLVPICSHCKRIRDDEGYWESVETYIGQRSEALFSHSICTDCGPREYGRDWSELPPSGGAPPSGDGGDAGHE